MTHTCSSRSLLVLVALLITTCRENRPELSHTLASPGLGLGVTPGQPSTLHFDSAAAQFVFGAPAAPSPSALPQVRVGTGTQVRLGARSSAVGVLGPGSSAGVKLRPVEGPDGFSAWGPGVASGSAVVYASGQGHAAVVERASPMGLKEDIVLSRSLGDSLRFTWELELGEGLEARLEGDGSVGIYGVASVLGGDIQVSDDRSRVLIEKARRVAGKTELRFLIPAPTVRVATGATVPDRAYLELGTREGTKATLTLVASGLDDLAYPVSLDPSIVVPSSGGFAQGNLEAGVQVDASGKLRRARSQFGVGSFAATTPLPSARSGHSSVAFNGYLYVIGGHTGATSLGDVQVAPLNANGTLGAFTPTTGLSAPRANHTSVAWNGYLYVIGGYTGSYLNTVEVAPINATNGTLGPFTATTAFPTARSEHTSLAWKGFLYVIGGRSAGGYLDDVQVAPLNGNGTVGSFVATASLPAARSFHSSAVYNDYLYVIGGTNGVVNYNTVHAAPLSANGTLGAFANVGSFTTPRNGHASIAANGYLYVIGGTSGTAQSDVQAAAINANGTLGVFRASNNFGTARYFHSSVTANGYVYVIGGRTGSAFSDVQVAPINAQGTVGVFSATSPLLTSARFGHAALAHNGFLYVSGGTPDGSAISFDDVQVATIAADGTLSTFVATSSFSGPRAGHSSVAFNGFFYVIGGTLGGASKRADIQVAPINPDGTLGTFTTSAAVLPSARARHTSVVHNGYLYVIGGEEPSVLLDQVWVARLNSDGTIAAFVATTALPSARIGHTSVVSNGFLYVLGGGTAVSFLNDVQVAPINANGTLGAFVPTTPFPTARSGHASLASQGSLYVVGGTSDGTSNLNDVQVAPMNVDGTVGPFTATSPFATSRRRHASVLTNGALYVLGGTTDGTLSGTLSDVQVAPVNANGSVGSFVSNGPFPAPRHGHTSVASNGYLYVLGGIPGYLTNDQVAPINPDGTLGPFVLTTALPTGRYDHASVVSNGYLYVIGGRATSSTLSDVQVAPITASGLLGAFTATTSLPGVRYGHSAVVANGYLYVVGGYGASSFLNDVLYAPINPNGTLGAFTSTATFSTARSNHASVAYNGFLYVIGGSVLSSPFADVQVAPLNANGSLGAFVPTSGLPGGRFGHAAVAENGFLHVMGGETATATVLNDVLSAPISTNGTLGSFQHVAAFSVPRSGHAATRWNGRVYVSGGTSVSGGGVGTYLGDVQVAALRTPAARGDYSRLFDFGAAAFTATSLTVNGSPTKGELRFEYRVAPASGVFGPTLGGATIPLGSTVALGGGSGMRYLWVHLTLDDTLAAAINPDAANERDVTDLTVVYSPDPVLTPASLSLPPRGSQTFVCSGGAGGYTFALSPNNSGGSVNGSGVYVAGAIGGASDTVRCTDSVLASVGANVDVTAGVSSSPSSLAIPPRGAQAFTALGGSGTGFVWSFVTNNSSGTLSPAGAYVAGTTASVVDTLRVTDSLLNTATVTVNVTAALSVNPANVTQPPRGTQAFTTLGGSGTGLVWSVITNNSGMTIDPGTGVYTAGTTGGVTDVIGVTDSLGNTASTSITVSTGVSLSPTGATVAPRGAQTFVPSGGSNTGFTWTFSSNASGGTVVGGLYTAGATGSVTDVVRVTDSLGNVATANVAVTAAVSASPPGASVAPRGTATFSASGGSGTGFTWSLFSGPSGGSVTTAGVYTAGATGSVTDVLRVTDSFLNFADVNVGVTPGIVISPATPSTPPSGMVTFSATNGSGTGFTWALTSIGSNGATMTPSGAYTAGTQQGTDVVRVTDSLGNTQTINVTVTNTLSITPSTVSLAPRAALTFTGTGGSGSGFAWTLLTNNSGATFAPATAAYQAGSTGNVADTIRLTDSLGNVATATVNVTAGLTVSPPASSTAPKAALSFLAVGGSNSGFVWALQPNASGGTINPATGAYLAGPTGGVSDGVRVTDSLGNTGTASVAVGPAVSVAPMAVTIPPRGTQTFVASGGSNSSFVWTFVTNASMGTLVSGTGSYTAGRTGSVTDVLQVVDALGNVAQFDVIVTAAVSISPAAPSVPPRGTILLMAGGGSGAGYSWFFVANRSGATLSPTNGLYQAGALANVADEVQVVDSLGNTATASINVTAELAITPQMPRVAPRQAVSFQAIGGAGGNRWTLAPNSSGASIGVSTGAYVAGPVGGTVDSVQVTDQNGNVATTSVTVTAALALAPETLSLPPRGGQVFSALGGLDGGYTFSLSTNASGGSIDALTGAYQAGSTGSVTDTVAVSDSLVTTTALVNVTEAITITPATAELAAGASQAFTAQGGSGTGFTWALSANGSGANLDADTGAYVAGPTGNVADAVQVTDSLGNVATARINVVGGGTSKIPPADLPPANGWSCGCSAGSSSAGPGLLALLLLGLFSTKRRTVTRGTSRLAAPAALLACLLGLVPLRASAAAPKKKAAATKVTAPPPVAPQAPPSPVVEAPEVLGTPPAPRPRGKPSVAVLDVEVTVPGEKLDGAAFSEMVLTAVDSAKAFKVISSKEITTMLGIERQKQLLGCAEDTSCMTEIASALGSEFLMVASVGRVGENYLVSTRLISGSTNKVIGRASVQAKSANSLLEAVWRATQQTLDSYGAGLPPDEARQWAARPRPVPPATMVAVDETPSRFGVNAAATFGYQPLSSAGNRGSVGAQVDLTFRRGRLDLAAGVVIAASPGARVTVTWALIDQRVRLDLGLRGTIFPGLPGLVLAGGGVTSGFEFGLTQNFGLNARVAVEAYPVQGTVILALLGAAGVSARF